jgi:Fibronectin type III domain
MFIVYQRDVTAGEAAFTKLPYPLSGCCTATIGRGYLLHQHVYEYKLAATNTTGEGPPSTVATVTAYYDLPAAPTAVTAVANGNGSVTIAWSAPGSVYFWLHTRDVTAGQTGFTRGAYPTTNLWVTKTGLIPGHLYEFQVTAENQAGEGPPSSRVTATA